MRMKHFRILMVIGVQELYDYKACNGNKCVYCNCKTSLYIDSLFNGIMVYRKNGMPTTHRFLYSRNVYCIWDILEILVCDYKKHLYLRSLYTRNGVCIREKLRHGCRFKDVCLVCVWNAFNRICERMRNKCNALVTLYNKVPLVNYIS